MELTPITLLIVKGSYNESILGKIKLLGERHSVDILSIENSMLNLYYLTKYLEVNIMN